jgi:hypothetical protein
VRAQVLPPEVSLQALPLGSNTLVVPWVEYNVSWVLHASLLSAPFAPHPARVL